MKIRPWFALLLLFCISSCSLIHNAGLQKRKYRPGYYFHLPKQNATAPIAEKKADGNELQKPAGKKDTVSAGTGKQMQNPVLKKIGTLASSPAGYKRDKVSSAPHSFRKFHKKFVGKVSGKRSSVRKRDGVLGDALGQLLGEILFWLMMIVVGIIVLAVFYFFCSAFALLFGVTLIAGASFLLYGIPLSVGICAYLMTTALLCFVVYFCTRSLEIPAQNLLLLFLGVALLVPLFLLFINGFQLLFALLLAVVGIVFAMAIDGI